MCGIFGLAVKPGVKLSPQETRRLADRLFTLSESRGKEAAGLAIRSNGSITVYKQAMAATRMITLPEYAKLYRDGSPTALIGHSRLVTNGRQTLPANNQPVVKSGMAGVHNGIITNDADLWKKYPGLTRMFEVDTEALFSLIGMFLEETGSYISATAKGFQQVEGVASIAVFPEDSDNMILATNNGSLYIALAGDGGALVFASEDYILRRFLEDEGAARLFGGAKPSPVAPGEGRLVDLSTLKLEAFPLSGGQTPAGANGHAKAAVKIIDLSERDDPAKANLRRCKRCILPETMPFIEFDEDGECNYCKTYSYPPLKGKDELEKILAPHRRTDGRPDCVFAFSGGRDSCYGLHLLKKEMGMNPVAFTYDWGMVTDLARRNMARLCGKLGVEHIIVSADIKMKREYIRKNVMAWMKRPELGMIPLFMAGDKHFYHHAYQVMRQTGATTIVFSENMRYERAQFKEGFCGINQATARPFSISIANKLQLMAYYMKQYAFNPAYINGSLFDTVAAFYYSYMLPHNYVFLYDYLKWEETQIVSTLLEEYNWELATDTTATWRIGDGTAPFYNYIYHTVAALTENDTFRSHQIRDGAITREEALKLAGGENRPRWETMAWYAHTIGFDLDEAIRVINSMPKLYHKG